MKTKLVTTIVIFLIFTALSYNWKEKDGSTFISLHPITAVCVSVLGAITITFITWFFDDYLKRKPGK